MADPSEAIFNNNTVPVPIQGSAPAGMSTAAQGANRTMALEIAESFTLSTDKQAKLSIILAIYSAQVAFIQEIRGLVERLVLAGASLVLLLVGWLVSRQTPLDWSGKSALIIGIAGFSIVLLLAISSLKERFNGFAYVVRRLNEVMMVYETSAFLEGQMLYPPEWRKFGSREWQEPAFRFAWLATILMGLFGAVAVIVL